jgi:hypothetical protein
MRHLVLTCAACCAFAASISQAQTPATLSADIAPQPLGPALEAFAQQTGLQLIYVSAIAETQHSRGARAGQSLPEALTALLDHTGLRFKFLNAQTVKISAPPPDRPPPPKGAAAADHHAYRLAAASALALEEVIVSATRRDQRADQVPISMAVWTAAEMDASGVKGMTQIGDLTPGVRFDFDALVSAPGYTYLDMRGVADRHHRGSLLR